MDRIRRDIVDLHVHTWLSDSTMSPAMAVQAASLNGVGLLAIADHEGWQGYLEAKPLCDEKGIRLIKACEMQSGLGDTQFHILCYAGDMDKEPLDSMIKNNRRILDDMSLWLIKRMIPDYPRLSVEEYESYVYDRSRGGWKGLGYLLEKGVTDTLREGFQLYGKYGVGYETAGFPSLDETLAAIHACRGRAVVAHCGHTLRALSADDFKTVIYKLIEAGVDGFECYYPLHSAQTVSFLRGECVKRGLMITAGSDCHGDFGHSRVGQMDIDMSLIDLRGI